MKAKKIIQTLVLVFINIFLLKANSIDAPPLNRILGPITATTCHTSLYEVVTIEDTSGGYWTVTSTSIATIIEQDEFQATIQFNNPGLVTLIYTGPTFTVSLKITVSASSTTYYADQDGDGFGDPNTSITACTAPLNYVNNSLDQCPLVYGETATGCPAPIDYSSIHSLSYDISGQLISDGITYYDDLGRAIQSQSWDIITNKVWASQSLYDYQGRLGLTTLSAPIGNIMGYVPGFIKKPDGSVYDISDFDLNKEAPSSVGSQSGTLGWYYSTNNNSENYQDITDYPFSRTVYSNLNPGAVKKVIGGRKVDHDDATSTPDVWLQEYTFTMPAGQELSKANAFNDSKYNNAISVTGIKYFKTVSRDVHGVEEVIFTDLDGNTLAAAHSGNTSGIPYDNTIEIKELGWIDFHIPQNCSTTITIAGLVNNTSLVFYDLITEQQIASTSINGSYILPSKGFYRVSVANIVNYQYNETAPITITHKQNYYEYTLNYFDKVGRLLKTTQPKSTAMYSTFSYNSLGQLISTTSPDEGTASFKYRKDGQIRFSQNSKQIIDNEFSYTNYDSYGRPVESGVYKYSMGGTINFGNCDSLLENVLTDVNIDNDGLLNTYCVEQFYVLYDIADPDLPNLLISNGLSQYKQNFIAGNVSKTWNMNPSTNTSWYSYDIYGRVVWIIQKVEGLGFKTIDYEYDVITGAVTKVLYQKNTPAETFVHRYSYDIAGRLIQVETSVNNSVFTNHARYFYNETGALIRTELADNLQGIDYLYNLSGQLKSINSPSLTVNDDPGKDGITGIHSNFKSDVFGLGIDYYTGDYQRPNPPTPVTTTSLGINQFNGNIKALTWNTQGIGTPTPDTYYYKYNRNNWLEGAGFNEPVSNNTSAIVDFYQYWEFNKFVYTTSGGGSVTLSASNNTLTLYVNAGFADSTIKTGPVVQINYPVPDAELGYLKVTKSTGEIYTDKFKVSIVNGWIVITADAPYSTYQYKAMISQNNSVYIQPNNVVTFSNSNYSESGITYDANGNILTLKRNGHTDGGTNNMDNFTYSYLPNKNQLDHVDDSGDNVVVNRYYDLKDQNNGNYVYNSIGQLVTDVQEGLTYKYNASGLVTEVKKLQDNTPIVKFYYDDKGQRIKKESYQGANTYTSWYVRDASGYPLAIYTQEAGPTITSIPPTIRENPVYGASRLGVYYRSLNNTLYQLTDHLGNVRAVIMKDGNNALSLSSATDYYPYGMPMPGRSLTGSENYRYAFQGQERDPETGKEAFELRLWDGRIGRWLSVDPYGEFVSPYVGMGNNPVGTIDPNGGCTKCPDNPTVDQVHYDPDGNSYIWDGSSWHSGMEAGYTLDEVFIGGSSGGSGSSGITLESVARTLADFTPVGSVLDIREGIRDGNGWQVVMGVGFLVLDVATLGGSSVVKGGIKTAIKVGTRELTEEIVEKETKQLLLTVGERALQKHHILPQQFRKWFSERGISNIDDYTIELSQKGHLKDVHGTGKWNKIWEKFIDTNPNATPSEIFHQAEGMLKDLGLQHLPYIKY